MEEGAIKLEGQQADVIPLCRTRRNATIRAGQARRSRYVDTKRSSSMRRGHRGYCRSGTLAQLRQVCDGTRLALIETSGGRVDAVGEQYGVPCYRDRESPIYTRRYPALTRFACG